MATNVTPVYREAEQRYKQADNPQDKLSALEDMLSTVPKHKASEKLQADIKSRISKVKEEIEKGGSGKKKGFSIKVEKEGTAQIVIVGPENCGKSQLIKTLTSAEPEIAEYPFTTRVPAPAMLNYENIKFQLVDLPAFSSEFMETWLPQIIREAHAVLLVLDMESEDPETSTNFIIDKLFEIKVYLKGILNAPELDFRHRIIPTIMLYNKIETPDGPEMAELINELYENKFQIIQISAKTGQGTELIGKSLYKLLNIIRVYTKAPGKEADLTKPYTLKKGSILLDLAKQIHKDFAKNLKYAKLWGSGKFDGQRVNGDYVLNEGDILELQV